MKSSSIGLPAVATHRVNHGPQTRSRADFFSNLIGRAECRICDYAALVAVASEWIDAVNRARGDVH